jgi:hypothetical protein
VNTSLVSERRRLSRVTCHIELKTPDGKRYTLLDFNTQGMRLHGEAFVGSRTFFLQAGKERIEFEATCTRKRDFERSQELGVSVSGTESDLSRLGFLAAVLAHSALEDVNWLPWTLRAVPDAEEEKATISKISLPARTKAAAAVSEVVHRRDDFVWKWGHAGIEACTLSCVPPEQRMRAIDLKLAYAVLITMIDDAVDSLHDEEVFDLLRRDVLTFREQEHVPERFLEVATAWRKLIAEIETLPSSDKLLPWFRFDHETICHAMTYALLVNKQPLAQNRSELHTWNIHSFYMFMFANVDLMFAPHLDLSELGTIRELLSASQNMCAFANWIGTWEREFRQRDLSSGVVARAYEQQIFTLHDLDEPTEAISLVRAAHVEEFWMAQWERYWHAIDQGPTVTAFDKDAYLRGVERIYQLQMIGRGKL